MISHSRSQDSEPSIDVLRTYSAVRVPSRPTVRAGTTHRGPDHVSHARGCYRLGDLLLGEPLERGPDLDLAVEEGREQVLETTEYLGVRGARGSAADHVPRQRRVDADNPVLVETEAILPGHPRHDQPDAREEK